MRSVLVINDFTPKADHTLAYAAMLSGQLGVRLLIGHSTSAVPATSRRNPVVTVSDGQALLQENSDPAFRDEVHVISAADLAPERLHRTISSYDINLIVRGTGPGYLNHKIAASILHYSSCPVLLVPADSEMAVPKRILYLTDLRYCQFEILSYAGQLEGLLQGQSSIGHFGLAGLPPLTEQYAASLFQDIIREANPPVEFTFNYIRESTLKKVIDVFTEVMHVDLLAMAYNRFHFNEFMKLADYETAHPVPILVFPG